MTKLYNIWSAEHNAWWKPGWNGYTRNLCAAGVYEEAEAARIVDNANCTLDGGGFRYCPRSHDSYRDDP